MATPLVQFETEDTIVLRGNDTETDLFGRIERTYNALDSHDPLEDCLIIAYVPVEPDVFRQFVMSGRPPKGYVFVEFAHEEDGHALLPEESIELISRALSIGDTVKRHTGTAMFGTVIDVQSKYLLTSIFRPANISSNPQVVCLRDRVASLTSRDGIRPVTTTSESILQTPLYEVNGEDLRRAEDFRSGDHVVSHDWFGLVESSDTDVAILLDNKSIVWVERPWELEIVVTNPRNKPLVSMPELDGIRRPDVLNVDRNGIVSMPSKRLGCGSKVVTNRRNLDKGRWLVGQYDPDALPEGVVLDVRTRKLDINWLVPNAFVDVAHETMPPNVIRPYENLTSFRNARELRPRKDLTRYDHHRKPIPREATNSSTHSVSSGDPYYPGDRVRFRSPRQNQRLQATKISGADVQLDENQFGIASSGERNEEAQLDKSIDDEGTKTGDNVNTRPDFVPRAETFEFDLNEYMVCWGYHKAVVLWQNGTESTLDSTELTPYSLPETDLCPGDLVMGKEGMKMTGFDAEGTAVTSEFNEMSFFEKDQVLQPTKVGIIQSVDGQERLARVRWYADPHIRLSAFGQVLQEARFGKIGNAVEDVSSYEIMKAPVLVRQLGDFVIIPPGNPTQALEPWRKFTAAPEDFFATNPPGPTTLSYLLQTAFNHKIPPILYEIAQPFAEKVHVRSPATPKYDWLGEIIGFGLDGSLTVRLGGMKDCQDVRMSHENILLILDDEVMFGEPEEAMDVDSNRGEGSASIWEGDSVDLQSDEASAIDEVVEYEGGARLDNESGEDDWSTDEDTSESFVDAKETNDEDDSQDIEMGDAQPGKVENTDNHTIHQRIDLDFEASEASELDNPANTDPATRAFTAQAMPPMLVPDPEESVRNPASVSLAQFLHQVSAPTNFEVLEQLPPPDQYHREHAPTQNPAFLKRITREHSILSSSLPANEIYVRTYESRLDLLRCLIIGPADTPYEHCPFVIDLHLGSSFPKEPPAAHFHSWTSGLGRINPNLYEEGKICLSLLGTWPGQSKLEGWSEKATILQLLVSLQGLVFVSRPFYNEAGFEAYSEEKVYSLESQQYSEKAYVIARGFAKYALLNAPGGLEDVLAWLYLCKSDEGPDSQQSPRLLRKVIERAEQLMHRSAMWKQLATLGDGGSAEASVGFLVDGVGEKRDPTKTFLKPLSLGAVVMLTKIVAALKETLQRYD